MAGCSLPLFHCLFSTAGSTGSPPPHTHSLPGSHTLFFHLPDLPDFPPPPTLTARLPHLLFPNVGYVSSAGFPATHLDRPRGLRLESVLVGNA